MRTHSTAAQACTAPAPLRCFYGRATTLCAAAAPCPTGEEAENFVRAFGERAEPPTLEEYQVRSRGALSDTRLTAYSVARAVHTPPAAP